MCDAHTHTQNIFICPLCFYAISSYNMGYVIVLSVKLTNKTPLVPFCTFNNQPMHDRFSSFSQFIWLGLVFAFANSHTHTTTFPKLNRLNGTKMKTGPQWWNWCVHWLCMKWQRENEHGKTQWLNIKCNELNENDMAPVVAHCVSSYIECNGCNGALS